MVKLLFNEKKVSSTNKKLRHVDIQYIFDKYNVVSNDLPLELLLDRGF